MPQCIDLHGCTHRLESTQPRSRQLRRLSRGLLWLCCWYSCTCMAVPEAEFKQLRSQVYQVAERDYHAAIAAIDSLLKQHTFTLEQQIRLKYSQASYLHRTNQTQAAIALLTQCKALSLDSADPAILYSYYNILAGIYADFGLNQQAISFYRQALEKAELLPSRNFAEQSANNLGLVLVKLGQTEEARPLFLRFLQGALQRNNAEEQAIALNNLGELEFKEGHDDIAQSLYQRALQLNREHQLTNSLSYLDVNLARLAAKRQQWQLAQQLAADAVALRQHRHDVSKVEATLLQAQALFQLAETSRAEQLVQQSLQLAYQHADLTGQINGELLQADISERLGQPRNALLALRRALKAQAAQASRNLAMQLAQASADAGVQIRETQIKQLQYQAQLERQQQLSQQRLWQLGIGGALLLCGLIAAFSWKLRRKNQLLASHINEIEQTRAQLVEAEKMAALTHLVSGMAHQLNTPLGNMITAQSYLAEQLQAVHQQFSNKQLSAQQLSNALDESEQALALAKTNADRAAQLVEQFKQISTALEQHRTQQLDLTEHCQTQLAWLTAQLHIRNLPCRARVVGAAPRLVTDPLLVDRSLHCVLQNMLDHAVHADRTLAVAIALVAQPHAVKIYLADNGDGVPAAQRAKVLEPFVGSRWGQGQAGLGLSIAYNSVKQLHGTLMLVEPSLWPASLPVDFAIGTLVLIELPLTSQPQPGAD